ncbi:MAG: Asp-tRNA(Asn)/Glu-tRNA(Gln) amidotransferase subunit GatA [Candidatus Marinimicrobia bacterium]|nr:Asp-tRNA(Asn)/Glu-tRNA(Gln) amidotransferase subunit GatA [Candidatus Neomarinimicrobiota bacterium]MDD5581783.1 Asp-tRNA(Asn)/Glu-tRNA(Gln) amidotransferase subunit GatA [Candidatus Neomarinimicrobiota bacterium]
MKDSIQDRISELLDNLEKTDNPIFITIDKDWLWKHVKEQATIEGPLSGKIIAVKDNINVRGLPTTCASRILETYYSLYDATVIEKIRVAGGILLGKTNMDEFAMGSSTEYSAWGEVRNPIDETRVPGGSSGGSASAVSAGFVDYALGSDTGGSIRQPAAFTGTVGLKPTYGRVSRYGLTAYASSFDQIGPITKTVSQSAELLNVIAGKDSRDSTSADVPVPNYLKTLQEKVQGYVVGIPWHLLEKGVDEDVLESFKDVISRLEKEGVRFKKIELKYADYAIATYYILATAEASSNLARFDGVRYGVNAKEQLQDLFSYYAKNRSKGFGPEVKRRIMLGTYVLSSGYYEAYYTRGQKVRNLIAQEFFTLLNEVDALMFPTTPTTAFKLGENVDDPLKMYLNDVFTVSVNIAGLPAISVPGKPGNHGLPVGCQIIGNAYEEGTILQLGHTIERSRI